MKYMISNYHLVMNVATNHETFIEFTDSSRDLNRVNLYLFLFKYAKENIC